MYTEEIVRIAQRENNTKRKYLVINRLQGKHVPVKPSTALAMFGELAGKVKNAYEQEKLLLVGFAETATAIGAAIAENLDCYYIQTTRESDDQVEYIYFTESHSHATEQKLVREDMEAVLPNIDRIVFVEDEITTGNTIRKIIDIIKEKYAKEMKFSVASLLNGMNVRDRERYEREEIDLLYLVKTDHSAYAAIAESYLGDGAYYKVETENKQCDIKKISSAGYFNARRAHKSSDATVAHHKLWEQIATEHEFNEKERILVLGTEEFMYPALYVASQIEKAECEVWFHATTRSPIAVSSEAEYPLHRRYELRSLYEKDRVTYVYELAAYDRVFVLTDAEKMNSQGLSSLLGALEEAGNDRIEVMGWC